jgi:hypothetical protein
MKDRKAVGAFFMSSWSIAEHSDSRLVAQAIPPRSHWSHRAFKVMMSLIAYVPGSVALLIGFSSLPETINCQNSLVNPQGMECRGVKKFFNMPISTTTIQLSGREFSPYSHNIPGDSSYFGFGLLWLGGVTAGLTINKLLAPQKTNWTFDRTTKTVQQQSVTLLPKTAKTFPQSDIHGLILEIPDLATDATQANIFVRLNMNAGETSTQYLFWNENQPAVHIAPYPEFPAVVAAVVQPICQILDLSWQLKFFHQDECFIFDFTEGVVDRYLNGEQLLHIEFATVISLEIEEPPVEPASDDPLANMVRESVHYLNLVLKQGERLRIHQFTNSDSLDHHSAQEWMKQLQQRLGEMIKSKSLV